MRRLNKIHGHYDIPDDEFAFVLATTIVGPVRWINEFGWRPLDPRRWRRSARVTTRFGELMGLKGLPTTYDGYERLLVDYETERFEFTPANRRLTEASIRIAREVAPPPDEAADPQGDHRADGRAAPGRPRHAEAAGLVRPRRARRAALAGTGARGSSRPRRTAYHHKPSTYPMGYRLGDLGPASMLDDLNEKVSRPESA